jgi:hypothetical protein
MAPTTSRTTPLLCARRRPGQPRMAPERNRYHRQPYPVHAAAVAFWFTGSLESGRSIGATGLIRSPRTLTTYPERVRFINISTISLCVMFFAKHVVPNRQNASGEMTTAVFARAGAETAFRLVDLAIHPGRPFDRPAPPSVPIGKAIPTAGRLPSRLSTRLASYDVASSLHVLAQWVLEIDAAGGPRLVSGSHARRLMLRPWRRPCGP